MRVVIPLIESIEDNIELRYCLRSIEKHLTGCDSVTIIGHKPEWLKNVKQIPFRPATTNEFKEANIFFKLRLIKEPFLYFNDDHFLLTDFKARKFPYFYSGTLQRKLESISRANVYRNTIINTIKVMAPVERFFGIHCPILITQLDRPVLDWKVPFGYCLRSIYTKEPAIEIADLKLTTNFSKYDIYNLIEGRPFFSTGDAAVCDNMKEVWEELYPKKSFYEI